MGVMISRKIVQTRIWNDPKAPPPPDHLNWHETFPVTVIDAIREDFDPNSTSLRDILEGMNAQIRSRQPIFPGRPANYIMTFAGVDGGVGAIQISKDIPWDPDHQTHDRIPTEKAVGDLLFRLGLLDEDGNIPEGRLIRWADIIGRPHIYHQLGMNSDGVPTQQAVTEGINEVKGIIDTLEEDHSNRIDFVTNRLNTHMNDTNNPHMVTLGQIGAAAATVLEDHMNDTNNPHVVTRYHLDLENVDNTSDLDKPISNDTQDALDALQLLLDALTGTVDDLNFVTGMSYARPAGNLTVFFRDGSTIVIHIPIDGLVQDIRYDIDTKDLLVTKLAGDVFRVSLADLFIRYIGSTGTHVTVSIQGSQITGNQIIRATLNNESITAAQIASDSLTTRVFADRAVTGRKIDHLTITSINLANHSVTSEKIAELAVTTTRIADRAVTGAKLFSSITDDRVLVVRATGTNPMWAQIIEPMIATNAIETRHILNENVTAGKMADGAATTRVIANLAVTTDKLADLAVTNAKISNGTITGNKFANSITIPGTPRIEVRPPLDSYTTEIPDTRWVKDVLSSWVFVNSNFADRSVDGRVLFTSATGNRVLMVVGDGSDPVWGQVNHDMMGDNSIDNRNLRNNAVSGRTIGHRTIEERNMGDNSVARRAIAPDSVDGTRMWRAFEGMTVLAALTDGGNPVYTRILREMLNPRIITAQHIEDRSITLNKLEPAYDNGVVLAVHMTPQNPRWMKITNLMLGSRVVDGRTLFTSPIANRVLTVPQIYGDPAWGLVNGEMIQHGVIRGVHLHPEFLVDTGWIPPKSITNEHIADWTIQSNNIAPRAITGVELFTSPVPNRVLGITTMPYSNPAWLQVVSDMIEDRAVTPTKFFRSHEVFHPFRVLGVTQPDVPPEYLRITDEFIVNGSILSQSLSGNLMFWGTPRIERDPHPDDSSDQVPSTRWVRLRFGELRDEVMIEYAYLREIIERLRDQFLAHVDTLIVGPTRDFVAPGAHGLRFHGNRMERRITTQVFEPIPLPNANLDYDSVWNHNILDDTIQPPKLDVRFNFLPRIGMGFSHNHQPSGTIDYVVDLPTFVRQHGTIVRVRFDYAITEAEINMNVNETGNDPVFIFGRPLPSNVVPDNAIVDFSWDDVNGHWEVMIIKAEDIAPVGFYYNEQPSGTVNFIAGVPGFFRPVGASIRVRFRYAVTVDNPTLDVNATGVGYITFRQQNIVANVIPAGTIVNLVWDGYTWEIIGFISSPVADRVFTVAGANTNPEWRQIVDPMIAIDTIQPRRLDNTHNFIPRIGMGYGSTGNQTTADRTVTIETTTETGIFRLHIGSNVQILVPEAVTTANFRLNINSTDLRAVFHRGAAVPANTIPAGTILDLVFDGTNYQILDMISSAEANRVLTVGPTLNSHPAWRRVTNPMLYDMDGDTFKGRLDSRGEPQDLTVNQMREVLRIIFTEVVTTTGSANNYAAAVYLPGVTNNATAAGRRIRLRFHTANTATTVNLNITNTATSTALGNLRVYRFGTTDPIIGQIGTNSVWELEHNGTTFVLVGAYTQPIITNADAIAGTSEAERAWTPQRQAEAVRGVPMTGIIATLITSANTGIAAAENLIENLTRLQAQINNRISVVAAGNGITVDSTDVDAGTSRARTTTVTLGTPETITDTTINSVSADGHTHELQNTGVTAGTIGSETSSPDYAGTFIIPRITVLVDGRISAIESSTITMPSLQTVTAGSGLTGGGQYQTITVTMGDPGSITHDSENDVTDTSHTHELAAGAVRTVHIHDGSVTGDKIAEGTILNIHLGDNVINQDKIVRGDNNRFLRGNGPDADNSWEQIDLGTDAITGLLPWANIANIDGHSVLGVPGATAGPGVSITAADHQVLRREGDTLGFGPVALDQHGVAVAGRLAVGTGLSTSSSANRVLMVVTANADPTWEELALDLDDLPEMPANTILMNATDSAASPTAVTRVDFRTWVQDTSNRFVSDTQIADWNARIANVTGSDGITVTTPASYPNVRNVAITNSITAGSAGPADNATPGAGATFVVPEITFNAQGLITSTANRTVTMPTPPAATVTEVTGGTGITVTPTGTSREVSITNIITAATVGPADNESPGAGGTFTVPQIAFNAQGQLTTVNARTITLPDFEAGADFPRGPVNTVLRGMGDTVDAEFGQVQGPDIVTSVQLPGTPTVETAPGNDANNTAIVTAAWAQLQNAKNLAICTTGSGVAAKVATLANWVRLDGRMVVVHFGNTDRTDTKSLNVNSTGPLTMQVHGGPIPPGMLRAGFRGLFIVNQNTYQLLNPPGGLGDGDGGELPPDDDQYPPDYNEEYVPPGGPDLPGGTPPGTPARPGTTINHNSISEFLGFTTYEGNTTTGAVLDRGEVDRVIFIIPFKDSKSMIPTVAIEGSWRMLVGDDQMRSLSSPDVLVTTRSHAVVRFTCPAFPANTPAALAFGSTDARIRIIVPGSNLFPANTAETFTGASGTSTPSGADVISPFIGFTTRRNNNTTGDALRTGEVNRIIFSIPFRGLKNNHVPTTGVVVTATAGAFRARMGGHAADAQTIDLTNPSVITASNSHAIVMFEMSGTTSYPANSPCHLVFRTGTIVITPPGTAQPAITVPIQDFGGVSGTNVISEFHGITTIHHNTTTGSTLNRGEVDSVLVSVPYKNFTDGTTLPTITIRGRWRVRMPDGRTFDATPSAFNMTRFHVIFRFTVVGMVYPSNTPCVLVYADSSARIIITAPA